MIGEGLLALNLACGLATKRSTTRFPTVCGVRQHEIQYRCQGIPLIRELEMPEIDTDVFRQGGKFEHSLEIIT